MRQALILCGGKAKRLRPYSYILPKSSLPFLNLPLLSLAWFYLEQLQVSRFLLNSHLFPDKLKQTVDFLSKKHQKTNIFFEEEPLGSVGTLYQLKEELQKTEDFIYINGDVLFFPSKQNHIFDFEKTFFNSNLSALFFVVPYQKRNAEKALWHDKDFNLKFIGSKKELENNKLTGLNPSSWLGMAWFKSYLLDSIQKKRTGLFHDFINSLLKTHKIKIYQDPSAILLEAGDKSSYLSSVKFCLDCLFQKDNSKFENKETVKKILEDSFKRFDFNDDKVGLKNGKIWGQKLNQNVLLPKSVSGLDFLKLKGPAVIGSHVSFLDETVLDHCVLDSQIVFKGSLEKELLIKA
ncbi:MAG: sugar phosphate nucleotidyltransferase [Bdellovibrionaceae bacterium]|nr:sugar phosphate nucleotidyltransferase [Pseudobdellovibrionaceae bacterium]